MTAYRVQVTGQSKGVGEKHYTTTTWDAYTGTDHSMAKQVAKEAAHGIREVRVYEDGHWVALWNTFGWHRIAECCDGTGWTGDPKTRCEKHYEPLDAVWFAR